MALQAVQEKGHGFSSQPPVMRLCRVRRSQDVTHRMNNLQPGGPPRRQESPQGTRQAREQHPFDEHAASRFSEKATLSR